MNTQPTQLSELTFSRISASTKRIPNSFPNFKALRSQKRKQLEESSRWSACRWRVEEIECIPQLYSVQITSETRLTAMTDLTFLYYARASMPPKTLKLANFQTPLLGKFNRHRVPRVAFEFYYVTSQFVFVFSFCIEITVFEAVLETDCYININLENRYTMCTMLL